MDLRDQIQSLACLEEVVERYLPLKRRSNQEKTWVGLCPFHADHHPSFYVNTKEQYYKCFACGEGGDVFKFVQKMEGCNFREALRILAGLYGLSDAEDRPVMYVPLKRQRPVTVLNKEELISPMHKEHLLRCHQIIFDLLEEYKPEEEVLRETYKIFEVGVAPSALPAAYADMCDRLIFPIRNEQGELVAFGARYQGDTKDTDIRKYVNSPNSIIYHKGELLYGLYQAKEAIREHGFVYITEGYKDVLAMYAAGFKNTVALCGISLTDQHVALLGKYTRHAVVMLDGDEVGQMNGFKSHRLLLGKGFQASRIILASQHDPDSLLREMGTEKFIGYIKSVTRFSRLEAYEADLLRRIEQTLSELKLALTIDERNDLFTRMMVLHKRLGKVSLILAHAPVLKAAWLMKME